MTTTTTTKNGAGKVATPDQQIEALQAQVDELKVELRRLVDKVYDHQPTLEVDRLHVVSERGVVEIGDIGENMFGIRLSGRGDCSGLGAHVVVDDGRHSSPQYRRTVVSVEGHGRSIIHEATDHAMRPASTEWVSPQNDRSKMTFRHGGYCDGFDEGEADRHGSWAGSLQIADLSGFGSPAVVEAGLLDDVARNLRDGGRWERTGDDEDGDGVANR